MSASGSVVRAEGAGERTREITGAIVRRKRADGRAVDDAPAYRQIMPYIMRGRNESAVLIEQTIDVSTTLRFIDEFNHDADPSIKVFDVLMWAAVQTLSNFPNLNRFVAGGRLYQRDGIWLSYSAKKEMADAAPVIVLKRRFDPDECFTETVRAMRSQLVGGRTKAKSHTDNELDLVLRLKGLPLRGLVALERLGDAFGVLPRSYIENDPLFASAFVANLGSLGLDAAYHHLYEYGTISMFCTMGRVREVDGAPQLTLKYSYDERVEDGFYAHKALEHLRGLIENPQAAGAV